MKPQDDHKMQQHAYHELPGNEADLWMMLYEDGMCFITLLKMALMLVCVSLFIML